MFFLLVIFIIYYATFVFHTRTCICRSWWKFGSSEQNGQLKFPCLLTFNLVELRMYEQTDNILDIYHCEGIKERLYTGSLYPEFYRKFEQFRNINALETVIKYIPIYVRHGMTWISPFVKLQCIFREHAGNPNCGTPGTSHNLSSLRNHGRVKIVGVKGTAGDKYIVPFTWNHYAGERKQSGMYI